VGQSAAPIAKAPPPSSPAAPEFDAAGEFDRNAAMQGLRQAGDAARGCAGAASLGGNVRVSVTFARTGRVADAHAEGPAASTPAGACIAGKFRSVQVPPFRGSNMTVYKTVMF
jgi:hypothetical protein